MHTQRLVLAVCILALYGARAFAQERQGLDDAWWTGPIVAAGAGTLPKGHALVEPYVFDVITTGGFDEDGHYKSHASVNSFGSLTYMLYGITDTFTAGLIPTFGYNVLEGGENSNGIGMGDLSVQGQFRLAQFREGSAWPTLSIVIQESLPTGSYDRLDSVTDGNGTGAYATTLGLYSQYYFWLPTGRILRARFNVSHTWPQSTEARDLSVYGTTQGFIGRAKPGNSWMTTLSGEYSLSRNWVIALDLIYQHDDRVHVYGTQVETNGTQIDIDSYSSAGWKFGVAPALEYNWTSRVGLIVGARWFAAGRSAGASVTPVAALNMVF
ncbi:MAG TPA: hypothetical protein VFS47_09870 [Steroidobacteraceae bacterium]|nr:hypothetical protein [Steroidobacteraceae bacterium]